MAPIGIRFEEEIRVPDRNVVGIEKQHFLETAMQNRIRLELPTIQQADGVLLANFAGIHAPDRIRFQGLAHRQRQFRSVQVPQFDGELAPKVPQHTDTDPGASDVPRAAAHHNPTAVIAPGVPGWYRSYESVRD